MENKQLSIIAIILSVLVTGILAVPVIQITIQQLGAGVAEIISPCNKAWVDHIFSIRKGGIKLDSVRVKFDKDLSKGTYIRVELRDSNDGILTSGEVTLQSDLPANAPIVIDLNPDLNIGQLLQYAKIVIVVAGQQVTG